MPTEIVAQNGAVLKQTTKIALQGCNKVQSVRLSRAQLLKRALATCRKQHKHSKAKRRAAKSRPVAATQPRRRRARQARPLTGRTSASSA